MLRLATIRVFAGDLECRCRSYRFGFLVRFSRSSVRRGCVESVTPAWGRRTALSATSVKTWRSLEARTKSDRSAGSGSVRSEPGYVNKPHCHTVKMCEWREIKIPETEADSVIDLCTCVCARFVLHLHMSCLHSATAGAHTWENLTVKTTAGHQ